MTQLDVALYRTVSDDLLTIAEVAAIVRAPIATLRYWRLWNGATQLPPRPAGRVSGRRPSGVDRPAGQQPSTTNRLLVLLARQP